MMAQMTLSFEFKLSVRALNNTVTIVKDSFEGEKGIITNLATPCSLNSKEINKKPKIFFLHSIYKSVCAFLLHFPDLINSIYKVESHPYFEPGS